MIGSLWFVVTYTNTTPHQRTILRAESRDHAVAMAMFLGVEEAFVSEVVYAPTVGWVDRWVAGVTRGVMTVDRYSEWMQLSGEWIARYGLGEKVDETP